MPKSFEDMSPEELAELSSKFGQLLQNEKASPSVEGVTAPSNVPPTPDSDSSDNSDSDQGTSSSPDMTPMANPDIHSPLFDQVSGRIQADNDKVTGQLLKGAAAVAKDQEDDNEDGQPEDRRPAQNNPNAPQFQPPQGPSVTDRLKDAQDRADYITGINQLGKAGAMIGSGLAGTSGITHPTQVNDQIFDSNIALAQKLPEQALQQIQNERLDPNSDTSRSARSFVTQTLGIKIPDSISADQLKEQFPVIGKMLDHRDASAARVEAAKQHAEVLKFAKDQATIEQEHKQIPSVVQSLVASRGDKAGQNAGEAMRLIDNTLSALDQNVSVGDYQRAVSEASKIFQGGASNMHAIKDAAPSNFSTDLDKVSNYLTPGRVITDKTEVNNLRNYLLKLKNSSENLLKNRIEGRLSAIQDTYRDPNVIPHIRNGVYQALNISPSLPNQPSQAVNNVVNQPSAPSSGGSVTIKSLKTGTTKVLDAATAAKYLAHPDQFQQVQ